MKISQEVRDAARGQNDGLSTAEIRAAMARKAEEFRKRGAEIYLPPEWKSSNDQRTRSR